MEVDRDPANQNVLDPLPFKGTKQLYEPGEVHDPGV
jgi:hypothetical protein